MRNLNVFKIQIIVKLTPYGTWIHLLLGSKISF